MEIRKNRILNPRRYLFMLCTGDYFHVSASLSAEDIQRVQSYGIKPDGKARIPEPKGPATGANADGKWVVIRNKPKVMRSVAHAYHVIDWHGDDHYGTCYQSRLCYQRNLIPPTNLAFVVENGVLHSPLFENREEAMPEIKAAMNIILEMIGHCEIWTAEKTPSLPPVRQYEVPWEILRSGTRDKELLASFIEKSVHHKPKTIQAEIRSRHQFLQDLNPEFCAIGTQNFFGYVVYGYPNLDLFIFESNEINNATYAFRGDWKQASKLTKMEVLTGGIQEARVYHTEQWKKNTSRLVSRIAKEGD